jgi:L-cystine uptake protein TcyP (sodium:dicarboxylate symporter family)
MSIKKLASIVISAILTIIAAVLGCVYGIEVDFSEIDLSEGNSTHCSAITHEQQK